MKKIETKEQKLKRKRKNQIIIGAVMIVLLTLSTAGFALLNKSGGSETKITEKVINGITFQKQDNIWVTEINGKKHAFYFLPEDLEDVEINTTVSIIDYISQPLYVVNTKNAVQQLQYNLYPEYVLRINNGCIEGEECEDENYPIKNCSEDNVIILKEAEGDTKVYQVDKCVFITGDLTRGTDKFLQELLQIT